MSLRWRLLAVFAVLGALAIGAANLTAWLSTSNELRGEVDDFLVQRGNEILEGRRQLPQGPGGFGNGGPPGTPGTFAPDVVTQVLDEDGAIEQSLGQALPVDDADRAVAVGSDDARLSTVTVDGVELRVLAVHLRGGGAVQIARELTETDDVLTALAGRLALITLTGAALAGLVGWLVARRITGPVRALADTAEQVAATQDLTTPIPVQGDDEVGRLARSFNTMLGALSDSRRQQQQLIQDASHELRTPLTSLRTSAELLERGPDIDPDERNRLLAVVAGESKELSELVTELVDLATDQRAAAPYTEVALDEIVARAVRQSRDRTGREIALSTEPALVAGDVVLLERMVRNLLDNADKFSPAGTPVEVTLVTVGAAARLVVADHGPGIPPEDQERVFDRFYRSAATRTLPGSGLGLAIVAQVVDVHGGEVRAGGRDGGGAVLTVVLPLSADGKRR
ncbi:MAG TPA: HAMP domain-containing sensor histidine kinase [Acidimicrobiales bacterium]